MKTLFVILAASLLVIPACTFDEVLDHPVTQIVGRVATNAALTALASKVASDSPETADALLAILDGVQRHYSAPGSPKPDPVLTDDLAARQLQEDLHMTLAATPEHRRAEVVAAVREGLANPSRSK